MRLFARRTGWPWLPRAKPTAEGEAGPAADAALERLVERFEARLIARESALAARERDLREALTELRAAQAEAASAEAGRTAPGAGEVLS